jgi:NTP pyrophosphatase (non-canonical NTP hydrolase)
MVRDRSRSRKMPLPGGTLPGMKKPTASRRSRGKKPNSWQALSAEVRRFRDARDWAQFHTPKNLAAAIAIEAAELQEQFLWKTDKEIDRDIADGPKRAAVIDEIADVLMFALLLADRLEVDVAKAITHKLAANERKYPVALARGNARKYTELREP